MLVTQAGTNSVYFLLSCMVEQIMFPELRLYILKELCQLFLFYQKVHVVGLQELWPSDDMNEDWVLH